MLCIEASSLLSLSDHTFSSLPFRGVLLMQAANKAGMRCIVTYTHSTADQDFPGAERIMSHIKDDVHMKDLLEGRERSDDRPGRS